MSQRAGHCVLLPVCCYLRELQCPLLLLLLRLVGGCSGLWLCGLGGEGGDAGCVEMLWIGALIIKGNA